MILLFLTMMSLFGVICFAAKVFFRGVCAGLKLCLVLAAVALVAVPLLILI